MRAYTGGLTREGLHGRVYTGGFTREGLHGRVYTGGFKGNLDINCPHLIRNAKYLNTCQTQSIAHTFTVPI